MTPAALAPRRAPDVAPDPVAALHGLRTSVAGVRGALLATVDGRPYATMLPDHDDDSTAAIVAAALGLGRRLSDLTGEGDLREIVVRSRAGYVVIHAVGERGVLTVLTTSAANLALVHRAARALAADLAPALDHLATTGRRST